MSKYQVDTVVDAVSTAADFTSTIMDLRLNYGYCAVATFTGSPAGTIIIQGSLDKETWVTLDTLTIAGTTPQSVQRDAVYFMYVRAFHVGAAGVGTATVKLGIKGA
jgi:hypothetical protein